MNKSHFKLFANCQIVQGYKRAIIIDLQNQDFLYLTDPLIDILKKSENLTINELISFYKDVPNSFEVIKSFLNALSSKGYGFFTNEPDNFPKLKLTYEYPGLISNAILYFNNITSSDSIFQQLSNLGTECLGIILTELSPKIINEIYEKIKGKRFKSMQFFYESTSIEEDESLEKAIIDTIPALTHLYFFNCKEYIVYKKHGITIVKTKTPLSSIRNAGSVASIKNFAINIMNFRESLNFNTYLNHKVCIDENGDIKNSMNCDQVYGNINNASIKEIISTVDFQRYWPIHKESIDICKHCEYRHVCVDNRIPKQRVDNTWYHEIECNYNPYIAKWINEEGYKTLNECGVQCNELGLKIKAQVEN